jgi:electron transport complex protein RnfE
MKAFTYEMYQVLGIFIPLIITNCAILGRADSFAYKNPFHLAFLDGIFMGLGFTMVLVLLGSMRELLGKGTLMENIDLLFGPSAINWTWIIFSDYNGLLLAVLPPGAFIGIGLIIATKNLFENKILKRA